MGESKKHAKKEYTQPHLYQSYMVILYATNVHECLGYV